MSLTDSQTAPPRKASRWFRFSLASLLFLMLCFAGIFAGVRIGLERLKLSPDPLQMTVVQRKAQEIPGLQGLAWVELDDITDGQVLLSVHDQTQQVILKPVSVRQGDVVPFQVRGQTFYVRVVRLQNNILGDDFGVFEISTQKD